MSTQPFGVIPTGHSVITEPTSTPSPTSFLYSLPSNKAFSHIVVFLLPGVVLPPDTAAAIYLATLEEVKAASASGRTPNFKFLGGIGPGKESSVFKVSGTDPAHAGADLVLGVSVEASASVAERMSEISGPKAVTAAGSGPSPVVLAQKIIKSAFNFLASFSGNSGPGGVEVVPLKAFEEWWRKYEGRLRSDPGFLDRDSE